VRRRQAEISKAGDMNTVFFDRLRTDSEIQVNQQLKEFLSENSVGPFVNLIKLMLSVSPQERLDFANYLLSKEYWDHHNSDFPVPKDKGKDIMLKSYFTSVAALIKEKKADSVDLRLSANKGSGPLIAFLNNPLFFEIIEVNGEIDGKDNCINLKKGLELIAEYAKITTSNQNDKPVLVVDVAKMLKENPRISSNKTPLCDFGETNETGKIDETSLIQKFLLAYQQYRYESLLTDRDSLESFRSAFNMDKLRRLSSGKSILATSHLNEESFRNGTKVLRDTLYQNEAVTCNGEKIKGPSGYDLNYVKNAFCDSLLIICGYADDPSIFQSDDYSRKREILLKIVDKPGIKGQLQLFLSSINDVKFLDSSDTFPNAAEILRKAIDGSGEYANYWKTLDKSEQAVLFRLSVANCNYFLEQDPKKKEGWLDSVRNVCALLVQGLIHCSAGKNAAFFEALKAIFSRNAETGDCGNWLPSFVIKNATESFFQLLFNVPNGGGRDNETVMYRKGFRKALSLNKDIGIFGIDGADEMFSAKTISGLFDYFKGAEEGGFLRWVLDEVSGKYQTLRSLREIPDEGVPLRSQMMNVITNSSFFEHFIRTIWKHAMTPQLYVRYLNEVFSTNDMAVECLIDFLSTEHHVVLSASAWAGLDPNIREWVIVDFLTKHGLLVPGAGS
jgi:hypothetical protein